MQVSLAIVTIERPHAVARLVRSARRLWPDMPIHVADQSHNIDALRGFYAAQRVNLVRLPFDAGLAASRNALVSAIDEEFFLLCDDDFVLGPCSDVSDAVSVLKNASDIAVVGGRLHDLDGAGERVRNWEMFFQYDRRNRTFTAVPIYNFAPLVRSVAAIDVYLGDAVMNFCVFRRSIFTDEIHWDERIKINGEHEDFYLNLKLNTEWRVAYLPTMAALHCQPLAIGNYKALLRGRQEGWRYFLEKWEIDQHLEIGTGVRGLEEPVQQWFSDASARDCDDGTYVYEALRGKAQMPADAGVAFMRLRSRFNRHPEQSNSPNEVPLSLQSLLDSGDDLASYGDDAPLLRFFYSPRANGESLLIWCRPQPVEIVPGSMASVSTNVKRDGAASAFVGLHFRWFDSQDNVLIWEGDRTDVEMHEEGYWWPIVVPLPVWPKGASYLRFEIVAEKGEERVPLATGFLFPEQRGEAHESGDEVMALTRPRSTAAAGTAPLVQIATDTQTKLRRLEFTTEASGSALAIELTQAALADVRSLLFLDWDGFGRRLAALETSKLNLLPARISVPRKAEDRSQILGLLSDGHLCRFDLLKLR